MVSSCAVSLCSIEAEVAVIRVKLTSELNRCILREKKDSGLLQWELYFLCETIHELILAFDIVTPVASQQLLLYDS